MAATRTLLRAGYGSQPADGYARRYDAPAARAVSRYDAPTSGTTRRLEMPAARVTRFRAPTAHLGTMYDNGQGVPQDYQEAVKGCREALAVGRRIGYAPLRLPIKRLTGQAPASLAHESSDMKVAP